MLNIKPEVVYMTEDGTYHETYDEALRYNINIAEPSLKDKIITKNEQGEKIPFENFCYDFDIIEYINLKTEDAVTFINELLQQELYYEYNFSEPGEYRYVLSDDKWINKKDEPIENLPKWKVFE